MSIKQKNSFYLFVIKLNDVGPFKFTLLSYGSFAAISKIFIEEHTWDITFMDLNGFCKFYDDWSFPCLLWIWKATLAMDNIFAKNDIRFFTFNLSKQFDKAQWKP